jgi:hypothetical protein
MPQGWKPSSTGCSRSSRPTGRARNCAGSSRSPDHQEVLAEPVRLPHQPGSAADQQRLGTGAAPLRHLPQDHQLLPLAMGRQALRRCQVGLRDRPKARHPDPSIHPLDPRRTPAAGHYIARLDPGEFAVEFAGTTIAAPISRVSKYEKAVRHGERRCARSGCGGSCGGVEMHGRRHARSAAGFRPDAPRDT